MEKPSLEIGNSNWAIKEGDLLGYNRAGNDYLPIPITMTRASLGTRVNPEGLVEDVELLGDNLTTPLDFTTWVNSSATDITANSFTTSGSGRGVYFSLTTNKLYKINVSGVTGDISLRYRDGGGAGTVLGAFDTDLYFDTSGLTSPNIYLRALSATTATVTSVSVKEATIDNLARVDYTDGTSSLLVEPQRTNTVTYSEDFSQWTIDGNASITSNATTSPDGTENATKLIAGSSSGRQAIKLNNTSSGDLAVSVFAKKGEYSVIQLSDARNATAFINFDLLNGSVGSSSVMTGEIVSLGNDWYKCIATYNSASNIISMRLSIAESSTSARLVNFSGNGTDGIYIWGAQLEVGSYPTSYIKTSGQSGGVTRVQDQYSKTGISNLIGQTEGTFFIELSKPVLEPDSYYLISLNNAASNSDDNSVTIGFENSNDFFLRVQSNGTDAFYSNNFDALNVNTFYKIAVSYKSGQSLIYIDGSPITPNGGNLSNAFAFTATLDNLSFDFNGNNGLPFYGKVKQLQVFKTALTDDELTILTGTSGVHFFPSYGSMAEALTYTIE